MNGLIKLLFLIAIFFQACQVDKVGGEFLKYSGATMGTTYNITCGPGQNLGLKTKIDSLLLNLNMELSTYEEGSVISVFNRQKKPVDLKAHSYFKDNLLTSKEIYDHSDGYFDPTVMPLVNYWGFGYMPKKPVEKIDSLKVNEMIRYVGLDKLSWENGILIKENPNVQLDFSAIGKGYAVDKVGNFFNELGIDNYLIEIGGELLAKGSNQNGQTWKVGVNMPMKGSLKNELALAIPLEDQAMATSGDYRNFYEGSGFSYAHTINPKTGFPEQSDILSATVITNSCMKADGYATAFMAMGLEKAYQLAANTRDLEAIFLYTNELGELLKKATPKIDKLIKH